MKPKEYIEKHCMMSGKFSHELFIEDLTSELLAFCELYKANDNIKGFDNSVKVVRMKWDAISNKIPYGLPDSLWKYFYAAKVSKLREELCSREMSARKERTEEYKRIKEERSRWYKHDVFEDYQRSFWDRVASMFIFLKGIPTASFDYFGLTTKCTEDEIKSAYRKKSLELHPDKGGNQESFILCTEHKNKCLKWKEETTHE